MVGGATSFPPRHLRSLGRDVHPLGLACNYGIDGRAFDAALERGVSYVFWTSTRTGKVAPSLKRALATRRESVVLATGPTLGWFGGSIRRAAESTLKSLGVDTIDVFHLFWVGVAAAWTDATSEALVRLREEGKVRAIAISTHDRKRAGQLAATSPLDFLMIRYNAAHPGAEQDVFPHLEARNPEPRRPAIVAYTATSWRKLLKRPRGWTGPVMTAGDCYRFCLSNANVDIVLTGPKSEAELVENLAAVERGPLTTEERGWMRAFGAAVHG